MGLSHQIIPANPLSSLIFLLAVVASVWLWSKRKSAWSETSGVVAMAGFAGGLLGAKLGFVAAEAPIWWNDDYFLMRMIVGKTILGGLLGGWLGIEVGKRLVGERRILGDDFARIVPIGIALGRLSCLTHGCCQGRPICEIFPESICATVTQTGISIWPAPLIEILFQISFLGFSVCIGNRCRLTGQHFHLYLIMYGLFRIVHEFFRGTVRYENSELSPYMLLAGAMVIGGTIGFAIRAQKKQKFGRGQATME